MMVRFRDYYLRKLLNVSVMDVIQPVVMADFECSRKILTIGSFWHFGPIMAPIRGRNMVKIYLKLRIHVLLFANL